MADCRRRREAAAERVGPGGMEGRGGAQVRKKSNGSSQSRQAQRGAHRTMITEQWGATERNCRENQTLHETEIELAWPFFTQTAIKTAQSVVKIYFYTL